MDPNATLADMIAAQGDYLVADEDDDAIDAADRMSNAIATLDAHLRAGGALPDQWVNTGKDV